MSEKAKNKEMAQARKDLAQGEVSKAAEAAGHVQEFFPEDPQVRGLVTEIRARQDESYRQAKTELAEDDMSERERRDAIQTLVERGEAFFQQGQYAEAADAAQEIFRYESGNGQASKLIDRISQAERKEAKREEGVLRDVYRGEMTDRMDAYRREAQQAMDAERWGRARFAIEKMLLLEPSDAEANRLYDVVNSKLEKQAA